MPKTANEVFRDFVRYTGDGKPGEPVARPLPHGDPSSGVHNPTKADIREVFSGVEGIVADALDAAVDIQGATLYAADLPALLSNATPAYPSGTVFATRAEGHAYRVVSSNPNLTTAGGVYLRVLSRGGDYDISAFGAKVDGTSDDAPALQAACNAAVADGKRVLLPSGSIALGSPVTLDLSAAAVEADENRPGIYGVGSGTTEIKNLNASAYLLVQGNEDNGTAGHGHSTVRGIKFSGPGTGLMVRRLAFMSYEDLFFLGKTDAMDCQDVLSSRMWNVRTRWGSRGLTLRPQVDFSRPNAITLFGCHFGLAAEYGIRNMQGSNLSIYGGSIEGCGKSGTSGLECGIRVEDAGRQGEQSLLLSGVYIENNAGIADVVLVQGAERALYSVENCSFNRTTATNPTTHCIYLSASAGNAPAMLNVRGCAFGDFNNHVTTAANRYIHVTDPDGVVRVCTHGNTYETLAGWPASPGGEILAMATFDGTAGSPAVSGGGLNIASLTKSGTGVYVVNFRRPMPQGGRHVAVSVSGDGFGRLQAQTDSSVTIVTRDLTGANTDFATVAVSISR